MSFLHPDGSLIIAEWGDHWPDDEDGPEAVHVDTTKTREHPMYGTTATGDSLVSNGHLGLDLIRVPAGGGFAPHTHPGDHLLIVTAGLGTITYEGRIYPTHAGQVYMVEGSVAHAVGAITDHCILAVGSPHRPVDAADRMTLVEYAAVGVDMGKLHCLICDLHGAGEELTDLGCVHAPVRPRNVKMLVVGMAPAAFGDPDKAFVGTRSGSRLAQLLGVEPDRLLDRVKTTNVFKEHQADWQKIPRSEWVAAAEDLAPELHGQVVVACGHKVMEACGGSPDAPWGSVECVEYGQSVPALVLVIPHPSGLSRVWNEPGAAVSATTALAVARTLASAGPPAGVWTQRDARALEAVTLPAFSHMN